MSNASAHIAHPPGQMPLFRRRVLAVSDRLPIHLTREGGVWVGWPGVTEEEAPEPQEVLAGAIQEGGYSLRPVSLTGLDEHAGDPGNPELFYPLESGLP